MTDFAFKVASKDYVTYVTVSNSELFGHDQKQRMKDITLLNK